MLPYRQTYNSFADNPQHFPTLAQGLKTGTKDYTKSTLLLMMKCHLASFVLLF